MAVDGLAEQFEVSPQLVEYRIRSREHTRSTEQGSAAGGRITTLQTSVVHHGPIPRRRIDIHLDPMSGSDPYIDCGYLMDCLDKWFVDGRQDEPGMAQ
jgi:hypothetical protein